jgi:hypothetical protein
MGHSREVFDRLVKNYEFKTKNISRFQKEELNSLRKKHQKDIENLTKRQEEERKELEPNYKKEIKRLMYEAREEAEEENFFFDMLNTDIKKYKFSILEKAIRNWGNYGLEGCLNCIYFTNCCKEPENEVKLVVIEYLFDAGITVTQMNKKNIELHGINKIFLNEQFGWSECISKTWLLKVAAAVIHDQSE